MKEELKKLGLTEGEARAYLTLLELGPVTVGPIVKKSGISYSKIYEVLARLIEKGLVSFTIKEKTKHFQAIEPNRLFDFLDKKEKEIKKNKEILRRLLSDLEKIRNKFPKQESSIFIGVDGVKSAYDLLLENHKENNFLLFFYVYNEKYAKIINSFYEKEFHYFKKINLKLKGISNLEFKKSYYFKKPPSFIKLKYVNFPLPAMVDIYQDKILFIAWRDKPVAYLIHSKEIADNFREYFENLWRIAK